MDDKKFMKKVLAILEKQQAALKKMAQTNMPTDPFAGLTDPHDPLNPNIPRVDDIGGLLGNKPQKPKLDREDPWAQKESPAPAAPAVVTNDIKAKLDAHPTLAKLKGKLKLTPNASNPKSLDVIYSARAWGQGATNLQKLLSSALTGYTINNPIGYTQEDFGANY